MPSLVVLELGVCVGEDMVPSAFWTYPAVPIVYLNTLEAGPIEFKGDSETL